MLLLRNAGTPDTNHCASTLASSLSVNQNFSKRTSQGASNHEANERVGTLVERTRNHSDGSSVTHFDRNSCLHEITGNRIEWKNHIWSLVQRGQDGDGKTAGGNSEAASSAAMQKR
mmetsp:Transcript_19687/g.52565  ORF Transcript_19687/g.52565 Transcript_19687/m.52565 type:complete len:116 (-) Transcript_19687:410-757(-)